MTPRMLAKAAGSKTYEGVLCLRGHGTLKSVRNSVCVQCERDSSRAAMRVKRAADPRGVRLREAKSKMLKAFGITAERYQQMFDAQYGLCFCGRKLISRLDESRELRQGMRGTSVMVTRVDHDHRCCPGSKTCGKCVRGLLCSDCNLLLGKARDDEKILLKAVGYLRASATQQAQPVAGRESASEIEPGNRHLDSNVSRGSRRDELSPFI